MATKTRLGGYVRLSLLIEESPDGGFVSYCPELRIASQGESEGEALNNLRDATDTFLNTIESLGDRERIFEELGLEVYLAEPRDAVSFDIKPRQAVSSLVVPLTQPANQGRTLAGVG